MASILSATYAVGVPQSDGRAWVVETFMVDDGTVRESQYMADVGTDYVAHLSAMTDAFNAEMAVPDVSQ